MPDLSQSLAAAITHSASKQTYYTIRFFVDRELIEDAFRAYGYYRWVDDILDGDSGSAAEKLAFLHRQQSLLEACYRGEARDDLCAEEAMLVDLVHHDLEKNSGLQAYLRNMMAVMAFDARRRGQVVTQSELCEYTRLLATAVTEAIYYFIGHNEPAPRSENRYLAVSAAHITHMLRDMFEDVATGYFNIPGEYLQARGNCPQDLESQATREWVRNRVQLARRYFEKGREGFAQMTNLHRRLAGYAYTARFEWMLHVIERDNYHLRREYPERKSLGAGLWMAWFTLASLFTPPKMHAHSHGMAR